jgi:hypothetical protein
LSSVIRSTPGQERYILGNRHAAGGATLAIELGDDLVRGALAQAR